MTAAGIFLLLAVLALACQHAWWKRREDRQRELHDERVRRLKADQDRVLDANQSLIVTAASNHVLMHKAADEIRDLRTFLAVETERSEAAETALRSTLELQEKRGARSGLRAVQL